MTILQQNKPELLKHPKYIFIFLKLLQAAHLRDVSEGLFSVRPKEQERDKHGSTPSSLHPQNHHQPAANLWVHITKATQVFPQKPEQKCYVSGEAYGGWGPQE